LQEVPAVEFDAVVGHMMALAGVLRAEACHRAAQAAMEAHRVDQARGDGASRRGLDERKEMEQRSRERLREAPFFLSFFANAQ